MYHFFIRPVLFLFPPEFIHHVTFRLLKVAGKIGLLSMWRKQFQLVDKRLERTVLGITFPNPVGLAAGFDKDARLIDELAELGFGFIEIGTLTPKPQPGNDKPRLFRLPQDQALINRMGFNNEGVEAAVVRLKRRTSSVIVGGNIGKNKVTPNEQAVDDYRLCFQALYPYVDYFVVNVSSPNTPNLRALQEKEPLKQLLNAVQALNAEHPQRKPVLLKIAPDLTEGQLLDVVEILRETKTDGVIATNTTIARAGLHTAAERVTKIGSGGLSGRPLTQRATEVIAFLRKNLGSGFPIIGVGGIMTPQDAVEKLQAGADLVQIYTGFIYEGPGFVRRINEAVLEAANRH